MTATTPRAALPTRTSYATAYLRPHDLVPGDVILVERDWREIADVWHEPADLEHIADTLGADHPKMERIRAHLSGEDQYVVVRYWVEQARDSVTDELRIFRRPELAATQIPAGPVPYPDLAMYRTETTEKEDPTPC